MLHQMSVLKILASMVLQNYQNFIEMTSNMIYIVAFGGGLKCPCKIHLNTRCPPPKKCRRLKWMVPSLSGDLEVVREKKDILCIVL